MATECKTPPAIPRMNDAQLLTHLLRMLGHSSGRARALSASLLTAYVDLEHIFALSQDELLHFPRLGENAAIFLLLLPALMRRYTSAEGRPALRLDSDEDVEGLLLPHFRGQTVERVCAFFLDDALRPLTAALVGHGGANAVSCSVCRILELTIRHRASGVILAHNHPDGIPVFSKSDLEATRVLCRELSLVGAPLLEHFLLAGEEIIPLRRYAKQRPELRCFLPREWSDMT